MKYHQLSQCILSQNEQYQKDIRIEEKLPASFCLKKE